MGSRGRASEPSPAEPCGVCATPMEYSTGAVTARNNFGQLEEFLPSFLHFFLPSLLSLRGRRGSDWLQQEGAAVVKAVGALVSLRPSLTGRRAGSRQRAARFGGSSAPHLGWGLSDFISKLHRGS